MEINKKSLRKCLFFGAILLLGLVPFKQSCLADSETSHANTRFEPKNHAFSIYYPDSMQSEGEAAMAQLPALPELFLKTSGNFPTFNILRMPTPIEVSSDTLQLRVNEIVQNYREIGLLNTRVIRANLKAFGDIKGLDLELQYQIGNDAFQARVGLVPVLQSHYILTYLDRAAEYARSQDVAKQLFETFAIQALSPAPLQEPAFQWGLLFTLAVIVLLIFFLRALAARRSFGESS